MRNINKTGSYTRLVALLAGATMLGLASQNALAALTANGLAASGSVISNNATLTFTVGGVDPTGGVGISAAVPATFTVDNKVDVLVTKTTDANVTPNTTKKATVFTVTNQGNTAQRYALTATLGASTLTTPLTGVAIYQDNGATPGIWDATDTLYVDASTFGNVAAGSTLNVLIVADVPAANSNGQSEVYDLTAQTIDAGGLGVTTDLGAADTAGVDVVWADAAGTLDALTDGKHSATSTFTIASAVLTINKVATLLCDPINGSTNPKNIPGAAIQYAITISNAAGGAAATLAQVTDTLVTELTFNTDLISGAGVGTNCVSGIGSLSATGFGAVSGTGVTTYVAPGLAGQAVTAGATHAAGVVTVNFATLASPTYGLVGASLPAGDFVTVYFNAFVK